MPSVSSMRSIPGRLAPTPTHVIDLASSNARLSSSVVPIAGFLAPARTATPMPDRPSAATDGAAIVPLPARSLTASVVKIATSKAAPDSIFCRSAAVVPNSIASGRPRSRSICGRSASTTAFMPLEHSTRSPPPCAAAAWAKPASARPARNVRNRMIAALFRVPTRKLAPNAESGRLGRGWIHRGAVMLRHYVSLALRNFRRSPGAALLNVLTLALGLVCFVIVSGFVGFWQRAEQQFPKSDRTYVVTSKRDFGDGTVPFEQAFTSHYVARYLQTDFPQIERVARAVQVNARASYVAGDRSIRITDFAADADLLEILDLPFIEGDPRRALESPLSVVLTERVAQQLFGSDSALGKHIVHDGASNVTVTGVVSAIPEPSIM